MAECADLILWFGEGTYVERAKALQAYYRGELSVEDIRMEAERRVQEAEERRAREEEERKAFEEEQRRLAEEEEMRRREEEARLREEELRLREEEERLREEELRLREEEEQRRLDEEEHLALESIWRNIESLDEEELPEPMPEDALEDLEETLEAIKSANPNETDVIILPGCNHGNGMYKQTELYQAKIKDFLQKCF